jgi:hypothetical protein
VVGVEAHGVSSVLSLARGGGRPALRGLEAVTASYGRAQIRS